MSVHIFPTPEELATGAAQHIADVIGEADRAISLGLAGGGTPIATYEALTSLGVDWGKVVAWLGDERWVPHDHSQSNTRMAREALIDRVLCRFVAPDTAFGDPAAAATAYSAALDDIFNDGRPDLVLLGIGDDGHTASLFPGTEALDIVDGSYLANWVPQMDTWRLTASLPLLWSAREVVFLAQGSGKAGVLAQIIDGQHPYPAQRVAAGADNVLWMLDAAAAAKLRSVPR
jgi:6-phosphogluconolactonase